jgi:hypothetical protein
MTYNKIINEYINYIFIKKPLSKIYFINDKKLKYRCFVSFYQPLIEQRILYRYSKKLKPYTGYEKITNNEMILIKDYINKQKIYNNNNNISNEITKNFDNLLKYFINLINDKNKYIKKYNDNEKIIEINNLLKYRNLTFQLDNRLIYIKEKIGKTKLVRLLLRYLGYGFTGQHCSIPQKVYDYFYHEFKIRGEGFSSPFNSKLLTKKDTVFCTLFRDTDKYISSLGPFSYKHIIKYSDKNWSINPPYMDDLMTMTCNDIIKALDIIKRKDIIITVLIPKWIDSYIYKTLSNTQYLIKKIDLSPNSHYMLCNQNMVYMKNITNSFFILSKTKNIIKESQIKKLLKLWNQYDENFTDQSIFNDDSVLIN